MTATEFGTLPDGRAVRRLVLGAAPGPVLHLLDLGATAHRLEVTAPDGVRRDVLLGLPTPAAHLASTDYLGGTIGRYANRIAGGGFELDGRQVRVAANERGNHLHGGPDGFDRRLWEVVALEDSAATLELVSPDGDQGFPGEVTVRSRVEVDAGGVTMALSARTDAVTVVNLTSHAYFNLAVRVRGTSTTTCSDRRGRLHPGGPGRHPSAATARGGHEVRLPHRTSDRLDRHRPQLRAPRERPAGGRGPGVADQRAADGAAHRPARPPGLHRRRPRRSARRRRRPACDRAAASPWSRSCSRTARTGRTSPRRRCDRERSTGR